MATKNRVTEMRWVKASQLKPHPDNWRTHPGYQRDALKGLLDEIGIADVLIAYEDGDDLVMIDGHLRANVLEDDIVPVAVLDVDSGEAKKILATLDPISAMAHTDNQALLDLLAETKFDSEAVGTMLEALANDGFQPLKPLPDFSNFDLHSSSDIEQQKQKLEGRFNDLNNTVLSRQIDMTCPDCGAEFQVDRTELGTV